MRCRDCPYGLVDFSLRMAMCEPVYDEHPDEDRTNRSESLFGAIKLAARFILLVIAVIGMNWSKKRIKITRKKRE